MQKHSLWKYALLKLASLLAAVTAYAGKSVEIPLKADGWETHNDVQFVEHEGRESIHLKGSFQNTPSAVLNDFEFAEGIIEFDISIDVSKSIFPGIDFHITEEKDRFERIYFRPGNNHQINSFQYHPVYRSYHPWQLYGQHQRNLEIPNNEWFHVKVDVEGSRMAFYMRGQELPVFWIDALQSGSASGRIGFAGAGDYYISNLKITKCKSSRPDAFDPVFKDLPSNYLKKWRVSPLLSLKNDESAVERERFDGLEGDWLTIEGEEQGLINITRYVQKTAEHAVVLATTKVWSDTPQKKPLFLGYSDRVDLYLNGELVFKGNNAFRNKKSKMRSRVHIDNDRIELELREGENVLEAIVYERFGGWALMSKFSNMNGIRTM